MSWSPQQERALLDIGRWMRLRDRQTYRLFGYAGTGKTELAYEIGRDSVLVRYAAFTGKAAHVLRQRGCEPASTIHRLIFNSTYDPETKRYFHTLKSRAELGNVSLIIVDEASMVDEQLAKQLLSFEIPLLIIGDPAQLPPVGDSGTGFFMIDKPDAMLTEIHRQAAENPILRLAERIRRGGSLPRVGYRAGDALQITDSEEDRAEYDVVLVGRNEGRHRLNKRLRCDHGFATRYSHRTEPQAGEAVVCLHNDYSVTDPVFNGEVWEVATVEHVGNGKLQVLRLGLTDNSDGKSSVRVPLECFTEREFKFNPDLQLFDYGYALTVHKAQGSEWPSVMLFNEAQVFRGQASLWLYTGITRARERLTVVDYN